MYAGKGGAVPIPRWILIFRAAQLFLAILILCLTAYVLSVQGGGPLRPPLISTIIIAILTIVPILLLTTPLHLAQRRIYDPRIALLLDIFALLFWLASFAALASYLDIFEGWGRTYEYLELRFELCRRCRRAWRVTAAATVFSAIQFLLFLFSTLAFIYYYHCHLANVPAPGIAPKVNTHNHAQSGPAQGPVSEMSTTSPTANAPRSPGHGLEQHPVQNGPQYPTGPATNGTGMVNGGPAIAANGQYGNPPYSNNYTV